MICGVESQFLAVAAQIVEEMRAAVYRDTGFRCSAGIAHNKVSALWCRVAAQIVEEMRAAVYRDTGFWCSAGIAHNKVSGSSERSLGFVPSVILVHHSLGFSHG